ncbi:MAG: hypothetical protein Q4F00_05475 [bacterium]|nr:hypothetical protein [bacterium]
MRISFGRLAFSILLCSCLLGCCQMKEGVCAVSDGNSPADAAAGSAEEGVCGRELAAPAGVGEGVCDSGVASGLKGDEAASEAYVGDGFCPEPVPPDNSKKGFQVFSLRDKDTDILVESYSLPEGWQGDGQVLRLPANQLIWQSVFLHSGTGSVGFQTFPLNSYSGTGPYRDSPVLRNDVLAAAMLDDLRKYLQMENVKTVSSELSPHDTLETRKLLENLKNYSFSGKKTNSVSLRYHAAVSMTCGGKPYKADLTADMICWDIQMVNKTIHSVCLQNCRGLVSPASKLPQEQQALQSILASRRDNPLWKEYCTRYCSGQAGK